MKPQNIVKRKNEQRSARKQRVRRKIRGTAERPRLSVFRSNRFIYAQIIDDERGVTLASASSREPGVAAGSGKGVETAAAVGKLIAERAREADVNRVVFDKGWYRYHGRIRSLAEAVREAGLDV